MPILPALMFDSTMESGQLGALIKPWCPGLLLGVIHVVMTDCYMADLSHSPSRGQADAVCTKAPMLNHSVAHTIQSGLRPQVNRDTLVRDHLGKQISLLWTGR